ncbi:flagellar biosynthetic protein FliR [Opitutus terrae]|uniref:Type III secretion system inner membrane R protein n=1 Tax=Opitutus terrae (strain DSM 11246 / JCM 15787 / PB90-1) TaxID=452637 RepID=B1ZR30_OPITP|nr:flagellar biosynthetic protein FliR [Opitutus terrae]ACB73697.1 type III secretion system inner membrane R protein [Opitutus terrae PB90-1]
MTLGFLVTWMMVFLRTLGVILQLPLVAGRPIPVMARLGICVCIASLLAGVVPESSVPATLWGLLAATAGEILVGLALGFMVRLAFAAVEMAGRILSSEIGITMGGGMGVPEPATEPMTALISTFAVVLFFAFGGHLMMLSGLARSFVLAPAGQPMLAPSASDLLINATSHLIEVGVRIAAPFIAMNFLVLLTFSVLGRVLPKMNVFIVSFSMRLIAGFTLLASGGTLIARYLYLEFDDTPVRMLQLFAR